MPADYTQYPTADDIELLLKSAAMWPSDDNTTGQALATQQAEIAAEGAAAEFENRTGWHPFLASNTTSTRYFNNTDGNGVLELDGGLLTSPTVTVGGSSYTVNSNYYLAPSNAATQSRPYTSLQFVGSVYGNGFYDRPNQIAITGKWGYTTTVPKDAWMAILRFGAVQTLSMLENLQSIASISQDGFSKSFDVVGIITQKDLLTEWSKSFDKYCKRYARVVV